MCDSEVYDIIIVGAGPCGLATAARLREHTPAALFTDEEHRRYHWIGKYGNRVSLKHVKSGKISLAKKDAARDYKMVVLDATADRWLGRWNKLFALYDISHLRSPVLWHVDPSDRDALLAHAHAHHRESELVEIKNCVGRELSKHAKKKAGGRRACGCKQDARIAINIRERNDYYAPSQSVFCDHCQHVADRYGLGSDLVRSETVKDIDFGPVRGVSIDGESLFTVTTHATQRYAKAVIMAVGQANEASIPRLPSMQGHGDSPPQACHSMNIECFPGQAVQDKMQAGKPTHILIVGGGLTSAQLADLAVRRGVTKVWLVMRGPCRVKHFDLDLEWMGKYKNAEQARFWHADSDEERLEIIKAARGGGSVTPLFHKRLMKHVAAGRVELRTNTSITDAAFGTDGGSPAWTITADPPEQRWPRMDHIYFATGTQSDFTTLPYLQTMMRKHPIQGVGGFPCLTEDLEWSEGVPLFVVGKLATMRLGPSAPNLGGAKLAAERVAWAMERRAAGWGEDEGDRVAYMSGEGNMFAPLLRC